MSNFYMMIELIPCPDLDIKHLEDWWVINEALSCCHLQLILIVSQCTLSHDCDIESLLRLSHD